MNKTNQEIGDFDTYGDNLRLEISLSILEFTKSSVGLLILHTVPVDTSDIYFSI